MFSASLSLEAKDTPRTGKKYQGVFAVSRRGGDEKTDGRTKNACFLHRVPLKTRRVHQEAFFSTECIFRTPGAPLRYRASIPYTRRPSTVPNATSAKRRKTLPAPNFSNCRKREGHCKKRSPECKGDKNSVLLYSPQNFFGLKVQNPQKVIEI